MYHMAQDELPALKKILLIRLSSIGDIVLTTPILRALRHAYPGAEIGYLTKDRFRDVLRYNPYINRLHLFRGSLAESLAELEAVGYDHVLDLHRNLRSWYLRTGLALPTSTYPKANDRKRRMTWLKQRLSVPHIVERYAQALEPLGVQLDAGGLDFFYPAELDSWAAQQVQARWPGQRPYGL